MLLLNHIVIIVSSLESIELYRKLGFQEISKENRGYDYLIYLSNGITTLEIYVNPTHPKRISNPEALGLSHLCFQIENIEPFAKEWNVEIKNDKKVRFCFIYDPAGAIIGTNKLSVQAA